MIKIKRPKTYKAGGCLLRSKA